MEGYVARAKFKCWECHRTWWRGPDPVHGFGNNWCPHCGREYSTWLNHPIIIAERSRDGLHRV